MTKSSYVVTDKAGPRPDIAGSRRRPGDTVHLTDAEAEFEVSRGVVITQAEADKAARAAAKTAGKTDGQVTSPAPKEA